MERSEGCGSEAYENNGAMGFVRNEHINKVGLGSEARGVVAQRAYKSGEICKEQTYKSMGRWGDGEKWGDGFCEERTYK